MTRETTAFEGNESIGGRPIRLDPPHAASSNRPAGRANPTSDLDAPLHQDPSVTPIIVDPSRLDATSIRPTVQRLLSSRWLQESLMFGCPECGAPMATRRWLMAAECWQCGASVEVSIERSV